MMVDKEIFSSAHVGIIGAGPAGLIAADVLSRAGCQVSLFDQMPSAGRKFLIASKGGLNLTHSLPFRQFLQKYREHAQKLQPYLEKFGPAELVDWIEGLGFATFTGSSGRIFPEDMKGGTILHALLDRIRSQGGRMCFGQCMCGWREDNNLVLQTATGQDTVYFDAVLFALGGASWPQTGSNAAWVTLFQQKGVPFAPFKPANCGFNHQWSSIFSERFAGQPVKPVRLLFKDSAGNLFEQAGEFLITNYGVEGSLIYACSAPLREEIAKHGSATILLDLVPQFSQQQLLQKLSRERGKQSLSNHLRKVVGLDGVRAGLLYELLPAEVIHNMQELSFAVKQLPLTLISPRPIAEAISSAGGVPFSALTADLMLVDQPGFFCAGEMLDWEAPTGGFLLTACFSTGIAAAKGILDFLRQRESLL